MSRENCVQLEACLYVPAFKPRNTALYYCGLNIEHPSKKCGDKNTIVKLRTPNGSCGEYVILA